MKKKRDKYGCILSSVVQYIIITWVNKVSYSQVKHQSRSFFVAT